MSVPCTTIQPDNEHDKLLYKYFTSNFRKGWIEVGEEEKYCMPKSYENIADEVENFEVKDSDIFLTSHPKTGTTWTQEMIWMIINNLDFERGKDHLYNRVPFLEFQGIFDYSDDEYEEIRKNGPKFLLKSVEMSRNYPYDPRIIKTHMPFTLLPKQIRNKTKRPKIIHVVRNAKDTCVSYYYHCCLLEGYKGSLEEFCTLFLNGKPAWGPFWNNILSYWNRRDEYNILIIKFEDMKKNLGAVIQQVADYLDRSLTNEQLSILEDHLSFKKMKNNASCNFEDYCTITRKLNNVNGTFMRSGKVGSYKEDMSPEIIHKFDEWTKKNLEGTDLSFEE